jgi:hypothetical protein
MDGAVIDIGSDVFANSQAYVARIRVHSFQKGCYSATIAKLILTDP